MPDFTGAVARAGYRFAVYEQTDADTALDDQEDGVALLGSAAQPVLGEHAAELVMLDVDRVV